METYDIGSLPFEGDYKKFSIGVKGENPLLSLLYPNVEQEERHYFEQKVVESFVDKVFAGIAIPNYPQFRDMNQMFLEMLVGLEKSPNGYLTTDSFSIRSEDLEIPEVGVLRNNAKTIVEKTGKEIRLKICLTGPYTLALMFAQREADMFRLLAEQIEKVVKSNIFKGKYGGVELISVDEPPYGLVDDPLLDFGQEGRESLISAWELIFEAAKSRNVRTAYHLHSTTNQLFWQVRNVDIVESHVDDMLYTSTNTKQQLENTDKLLKASIAITDFDSLIHRHSKSAGQRSGDELGEDVGATWTSIRKGFLSPDQFLEPVETLKSRLKRIIDLVGRDRVVYAGPECGLYGFPSYESALELLRRTAQAARFY